MRKIIIQERILESSDLSLRFVFWIEVPEERKILYLDPDKTTAVKDATGEEVIALRDGSVVEIHGTIDLSVDSTLDDVKAKLIEKYTYHDSKLKSDNAGLYYGTYFDGEVWVDGGLE